MCSSVLYLPEVFSLEAPWNCRVDVTICVETVWQVSKLRNLRSPGSLETSRNHFLFSKVKQMHLMAARLSVGWRFSWIAHLQMATSNLLGSLAHFGNKLPQHLSTCQPSFRMHWSMQEVPDVYCIYCRYCLWKSRMHWKKSCQDLTRTFWHIGWNCNSLLDGFQEKFH